MFFKYLLEGFAVALAAFYIPNRKIEHQSIFMIALTAAAVFALLDLFSPGVAMGARQGSGFGIGYHLVQSGGQSGGFLEDNVANTDNNLRIDNIPYNLVR